MAFYFGKLLELMGIGTVSIAIFTMLFEESAMSEELSLLAVGAALFLVGRLVESRGADGS